MALGFVYFVFAPSIVTTLLAGRVALVLGTRSALWGSLALAGLGLPAPRAAAPRSHPRRVGSRRDRDVLRPGHGDGLRQPRRHGGSRVGQRALSRLLLLRRPRRERRAGTDLRPFRVDGLRDRHRNGAAHRRAPRHEASHRGGDAAEIRRQGRSGTIPRGRSVVRQGGRHSGRLCIRQRAGIQVEALCRHPRTVRTRPGSCPQAQAQEVPHEHRIAPPDRRSCAAPGRPGRRRDRFDERHRPRDRPRLRGGRSIGRDQRLRKAGRDRRRGRRPRRRVRRKGGLLGRRHDETRRDRRHDRLRRSRRSAVSTFWSTTPASST